MRTKLFLREFADAAAKQLLLVAECDVHIRGGRLQAALAKIVSFGMKLARPLIITAMLIAFASPAWADLTAFVGTGTTPSNRMARGFAAGAGLLVIGFEFEY